MVDRQPLLCIKAPQSVQLKHDHRVRIAQVVGSEAECVRHARSRGVLVGEWQKGSGISQSEVWRFALCQRYLPVSVAGRGCRSIAYSATLAL